MIPLPFFILVGCGFKGVLTVTPEPWLEFDSEQIRKVSKTQAEIKQKNPKSMKIHPSLQFFVDFCTKNTSCRTIFQEGQPKIISSSAHQPISSLPKTLSAKQVLLEKSAHVTRRPTHTPLLSLPPKRTTAEPTNHRTVSELPMSIQNVPKNLTPLDSPNWAKMYL